MAELALKKLEEQLRCSICLQTYTDPKQLQCHHVFCQQCLVPLVVRGRHGRCSLTCPNCRQVTSTPDSGVAGLQSAFNVIPLLDIQESLKKSAATVEGAMGGAAAIGMSSNTELYHCLVHSRSVLNLYCETCEELVCVQCIMKGGKHHDHDHAVIEDAYEKHKGEILSATKPMEEQVADIQLALAHFDRSGDALCDQRSTTEDKIHATFRELQEILNVRETELVAKLNQVTEGKMKYLAAQRDQMETLLAQRNSCLYFLRESLATDNKTHLLKTKSTMKKIRELVPFKLHLWKPNVPADTHVVFVPTVRDCFEDPFETIHTPLTTECQNYGEIVMTDVPDPSHCFIDVLKIDDHFAHLGTLMHTISRVKGPRGIAINQRGEVVVTEGRARCVSVFTPGGVKLRSFGKGQLVDPGGVAVDGEGNIVVVDVGNSCDVKFNKEGQFVNSSKRARGSVQLILPTDITFNPEMNGFYLVDTNNKSMYALNSDLKFSVGVAFEQFSDKVWGIACNKDDVYVADTDKNRVHIIGKRSRLFGSRGQGLCSPMGVCIDGEDRVYVSEHVHGCNRVSVFTRVGQFLKSFRAEAPGSNLPPNGLAVDSNGLVYVGDQTNNCIRVY